MKGIAMSDNKITKNDKRINARISNEMLKHINEQCKIKSSEKTKWDISRYIRYLILKDMASDVQEEVIGIATIQFVENTININNVVEEVIEEKVIKSSFTKQIKEIPETKIVEPLSAIVNSRFKKVYKKS